MANFMYDLARQGFLGGTLAWSGNIKLALVTSGYTPNQATDQFVTDLGANIVQRSGNLTTVTAGVAGVASADNETITAVTGSMVTYVVIFADTGTDATSQLILFFDTASGLPFTPDGTDVGAQWDSGAFKIFQL